MSVTRDHSSFHGRWRIVHSDLWDLEVLDMLVPAHITFGDQGFGTMELIAIGASIDYRVGMRDGHACVEFSWWGDDDGDPACGRGWAVRKGDVLEGQVFIHQGDESGFVAERGWLTAFQHAAAPDADLLLSLTYAEGSSNGRHR